MIVYIDIIPRKKGVIKPNKVRNVRLSSDCFKGKLSRMRLYVGFDLSHEKKLIKGLSKAFCRKTASPCRPKALILRFTV